MTSTLERAPAVQSPRTRRSLPAGKPVRRWLQTIAAAAFGVPAEQAVFNGTALAQVASQVRQTATHRGVEVPREDAELIARRAARNYRVLVGTSILWVDDNPASVRLEQGLLRTLGVARSDTVTSTEEAVEQRRPLDDDLGYCDREP